MYVKNKKIEVKNGKKLKKYKFSIKYSLLFNIFSQLDLHFSYFYLHFEDFNYHFEDRTY
jgi:hypothetical protein